MKRILKAAALGGIIGLAMDQVVSFIVSSALHLGYFMAYPASLPERVGGEMNAVLCQMVLLAWLGMGLGVGVSCVRQRRVFGKKRLLLAAAGAAAVLPSAALAVYWLA